MPVMAPKIPAIRAWSSTDGRMGTWRRGGQHPPLHVDKDHKWLSR
uniref:Uncharacterized protein n=1 Tax=Setaria italica TaxID=4555 RepID=K4APD9_SETIT